MKNKSWLSLLATILTILLLLACTRETVVLVENAAPDNAELTLRCTLPVDGAYPLAVRDTVSGQKILEFRFRTSRPAFTYVQDLNAMGNIICFPVEPGRTYRLSYDGSGFSFTGKGQAAQRLYAALPVYPHPQIPARDYAREPSIATVKSTLESMAAAETAPFDSLFKAKEISAGLHDLIAADREAYSRLILAWVGVWHSSGLNLDEETMEAAYGGLDLDSDLTMATSAFYELINTYASSSLEKRTDEVMPLLEDGLLNTLFIDEYKKILTGKRLEAATAYQIYSAAIQKEYEKELIALYDDFAATWPRSRYLAALGPEIEEIRDYYAERPADPDIVFLEDTEDISSLSELLSRFAGKKVYIDVWATWCGPCKDEFAYAPRLQELLKETGYEMLYISVDRQRDSQKWKEMIAFYGLKGHHVLAGEEFQKDLYTVYGENGSMAIPWNMIVDSQGNIVQLHAPRPSDYDSLKTALE